AGEVAMPKYNLGTLLLSRGEFAEGWPLYECRLEVKHREWLKAADPAPSVAVPRWRGEDASGKRLLVWPEQGVGDALPLARFAPLLAERGVRVALACHAPLKALFAGVPGVEIVDGANPGRDFDFSTFIGSLPHHLRSDSIPTTIPYLSADPQRIASWR